MARRLFVEGEAHVAITAVTGRKGGPQSLVYARTEGVVGIRRCADAKAADAQRTQPVAQRRPCRSAPHHRVLLIDDYGHLAHDGSHRAPAANVRHHQLASHKTRPAPRRRSRDDEQLAFFRHCRWRVQAAALDGGLHQGVQPRQRLIDGDMFLQLSGPDIGQAQPRALIAHWRSPFDVETSIGAGRITASRFALRHRNAWFLKGLRPSHRPDQIFRTARLGPHLRLG